MSVSYHSAEWLSGANQSRSGGIGRRAWFRSMYPQGCGGSSPFFGTSSFLLNNLAAWCPFAQHFARNSLRTDNRHPVAFGSERSQNQSQRSEKGKSRWQVEVMSSSSGA